MAFDRDQESEAPKDIRWKNVKTLIEFKDSKGRGHWLRIGHWVIDGKEHELTLEKRAFYETVSGLVKPGKPKGLNDKDLYRICGAVADLARMFRFPIPKIDLSAVATPQPDDTLTANQ